MTGVGPERGDGVGFEVTPGVLRGVRLGSSEPGRVVAAAEVAVANRLDDRSMLNALVRLRAELGDARVPTRVAMFPRWTRIDDGAPSSMGAFRLNGSFDLTQSRKFRMFSSRSNPPLKGRRSSPMRVR